MNNKTIKKIKTVLGCNSSFKKKKRVAVSFFLHKVAPSTSELFRKSDSGLHTARPLAGGLNAI
jgi:hypothetical protein